MKTFSDLFNFEDDNWICFNVFTIVVILYEFINNDKFLYLLYLVFLKIKSQIDIYKVIYILNNS
jgi:hypothetical protein